MARRCRRAAPGRRTRARGLYAGVLVLDDLAVSALRKGARHQLERLLEYRTQKNLPTFFIAEGLEQVGERAGAAIAALRHGAVYGGGHVRAESPPVDGRAALSRAGGNVPSLVRRLRDWQHVGAWERLHQALIQRLSDAGRLDWSRASLDSASVPAPGGEASGPNPTDLGKSGTKRHLVVERNGLPLAVLVSAANVHDCQMLEATLDAMPSF